MGANIDKETDDFVEFIFGYRKSEEDKKKYRKQIGDLIEDAKLFVAPVQAHNRGQHRADVYNVIFPIYTSDELTETLANCFACSKCKQIFLHLRTKGTAPFSSHKCYKSYAETLKKAEVLAEEASKIADEAAAKAKLAEKTVEVLRKSTPISEQNQSESGHVSSLPDAETQDVHQEPVSKRPRHAEVVATTIEQFVDMALNGKRVKADDIIDQIPDNFTRFSWSVFTFISHFLEKISIVFFFNLKKFSFFVGNNSLKILIEKRHIH